MEASRRPNPDTLPSDRLFGEAAYVAYYERTAREREADASELETVRQKYATVLRLMAQVREVMDAVGQGPLHNVLADALGSFHADTVHRSYMYAPKRMPDFDAEREAVKLYGSEREWLEDLRACGLTFPFPWEG